MRRFLSESAYRKSILKTSIPISILLGLALSFGFYLERNGEVEFSNPMVYLVWLPAACVAFAGFTFLFLGLDCYAGKPQKRAVKFPCKKSHWIGIFLILVACYSITFLAVFPGFFAYDATMAHWQYYYDAISTQHPWIHTLLLGYICEFSKSHLGHANVGIAIYIYGQMLFVAGCFTYTLYSIKKRAGHNLVVIVSFLFYALFPTIHMFALCSTKDTAFTAMMLVMLNLLWDMFEDIDRFFASKWKVIAFIGFTLGFLILRKNAIYAMLVFVPIFLIILKKRWWKGALALAVVFGLFFIYEVPLAKAVGVIDIGPKEALSVPSQQLARVYTEEKEILTEEEIEQLESYYPKEALESYLPKLADCTKGMLNTEYFLSHSTEYIKLWATVGLKAPDVYVNSLLINTYGFWYPTATLDGYKGFEGMKGTVLEDAEVYYFAYVTEEPGERTSFIPILDEFYYWLSATNLHQKLPVISLLFSPGFLFWVFVTAVVYSIHRKRKEMYPVFLLMGIMWLTVLVGPIALVRYVLFLFFGLPLILSALFKKEVC